jgi:hypothetical protein
MDMQILINIGFGAAGAFGMWIINRLTSSVDKIIFDRLDQKADK